MSDDSIAMLRVIYPVRRALRSDFVRHSALVFGATMLANTLNYAFNFALSRRLGVEGFATLSSLVSAIMILSIPASILCLIVVKYAATFHAAADGARVRRLSQLLLNWTGVCALAIFAGGMLFRGDIASFLRIGNDESIPLTLAVIALTFVTPSVRGILQGEQDFQRFSVSVILEALLKVGLGVGYVYAHFGVAGAMMGWLIGASIALAYTVWAVLRKHGTAADAKVRLGLDLRRLTQTTFGIGVATGLLTCISFMDVLLVKHYFDARQAGLYAAVNLTGKIVLFLVGFVPAIVLPKAVAKVAKRESPVLLLLQAAAVTFLLSGATLIAFGLMPGEVMRVIAGRAFVAAAPYVFQYDVAMGMLAVITLVVSYKIGIHRFDFLYALGGALILEVAGIALFHRSLWDIIHVLLAGNALAIIGCSYRITSHENAAKATAIDIFNQQEGLRSA